jgi:hypothetical protein
MIQWAILGRGFGSLETALHLTTAIADLFHAM